MREDRRVRRRSPGIPGFMKKALDHVAPPMNLDCVSHFHEVFAHSHDHGTGPVTYASVTQEMIDPDSMELEGPCSLTSFQAL